MARKPAASGHAHHLHRAHHHLKEAHKHLAAHGHGGKKPAHKPAAKRPAHHKK